MKSKLILFLTLLFLITTPRLQMAITEPVPFENPYIISEVSEAVFQVKADELVIKVGNEQDCQLARQLVTYALENQAVNISGMEYTVELKKLITSFKKSGTDESLVIHQYNVDLDSKTRNQYLTKFLTDLQSRDYLTDLVSQYQAPLTCHLFLIDNKLVLLTYYGLFPAGEGFNPEDFIGFLKK